MIQTIEKVLSYLSLINVQGSKNVHALSFAMQYLEGMLDSLKEEAQKHGDSEVQKQDD